MFIDTTYTDKLVVYEHSSNVTSVGQKTFRFVPQILSCEFSGLWVKRDRLPTALAQLEGPVVPQASKKVPQLSLVDT